ncbi:hypothetical protein GGH92_001001 [Coemansia sp. RSA 2673]|nr:hypothetical protein GGH92_001001 [Coemansia sp. RSA 2673]
MVDEVTEKIIALLGKEGIERSVVYRWLDSRILLKIGNKHALKIYENKFGCREADCMRVARDAGKVKCPKVIADGMIDGYTYVLMEWVEGANLGELWKDLDCDKKAFVLHQVDQEVEKMKMMSAEFIGNVVLNNNVMVGGSVSDGNIYEGRSKEVSPALHSMEEWKRFIGEKSIMQEQKFVFSHNDLGPWNVIVDRDSVLLPLGFILRLG